MIGKTISHYRILDLLGRGGMGVVYKAEDTRLRRLVALKFLSETQAHDTMALERLRREARAASALNHPNICAIHDIDEFQGQPFIVMELLEGKPLSATLDGKPQELEEILKIARQAAAALAASHEKLIIHRDIKPSNIMVTLQGDVKLLDFGLAKTGKPLTPEATTAVTVTATGSIMGTIQYMSPEQALGQTVDHRTDIFSLGVLLYEMATGRLPFSGSTMIETINHIINTEPEAISQLNVNIPPGLERVISRCLEKSAQHRFQSASQLLEDLSKPDPDTGRQNRRGIRNNLPEQVSRFIGRQAEKAEIRRLMTSSRLLTLAGYGGIGKTRLALEVAAASLNDYADGVWFVELASLSDESLVPQTIAATLGLREERGRSIEATIEGYVKQRRLLLILDNCEHLISMCARTADALLRSSAGLSILATSREVLAINGETVFRVPSLDKALELFTDRARSVRPDFQLTERNAATLANICTRLEGIPLAVELAASRVKAMSVDQIEARLGDRLTLLTGGSRTALPRQQTLRGAIDWSYNLLSQAEQTLFRRLSVFSGGCTLDAAETVCAVEGVNRGDVLELVSALVDKSLVSTEDRDGQQRYRFMATLQEYAQVRLEESGETHEIRRRFVDFFLDLADEGDRNIFGPLQKTWLDRLTLELDNLRSVLNWALSNDVQRGLRMVASLGQFWNLRGHFVEGRRWLQQSLSNASSTSGKHLAKALMSSGRLAWMQGDYALAQLHCEQALRMFRELGDKVGITGALANLGNVARLKGDPATEIALHTESLAISRECGHKRGIAVSLNNLGIAADVAGDYPRARALHEESLAISIEIGDKRSTAMSFDNLANTLLHQGDFTAALSFQEQSLAIRRELGDKHGISASLNNLGEVVWQLGDHVRAASIFNEALEIRRELGDRTGIAMSLNSLSEMARRESNYASAAALGNESVSLFRELGHKFGIAIASSNLAEIRSLQGDFDGAGTLYTECLERFREMGDKYSIATTLCGLGTIARRQSKPAEAMSLLVEGLSLFEELGAVADVLTTIERLATLALSVRQQERAAALYAASQALREQLNLPRPSHESGAYEAGLNATRAGLSEETFANAWAEGKAMTIERAIAFASKEE
jgi:non-specific serine/threonine protein kinase